MLASETWKSDRKCIKNIDSGSSSLGTDSGYLNDSGRLRRVPTRPEKSREYRLHPVAALVDSYIGLMELKTPNS